jgi:hypothetical protein
MEIANIESQQCCTPATPPCVVSIVIDPLHQRRGQPGLGLARYPTKGLGSDEWVMKEQRIQSACKQSILQITIIIIIIIINLASGASSMKPALVNRPSFSILAHATTSGIRNSLLSLRWSCVAFRPVHVQMEARSTLYLSSTMFARQQCPKHTEQSGRH